MKLNQKNPLEQKSCAAINAGITALLNMLLALPENATEEKAEQLKRTAYSTIILAETSKLVGQVIDGIKSFNSIVQESTCSEENKDFANTVTLHCIDQVRI